MKVRAPAKINLSLKILGRRSDGFHEIETLIAPISLCDDIKIERTDSAEGFQFDCDDPSVPTGDDNLIVRAAKSFFAATKLKSSVLIELKKRIPHGAGLGGGSSDAASALLALNEIAAWSAGKNGGDNWFRCSVFYFPSARALQGTRRIGYRGEAKGKTLAPAIETSFCGLNSMGVLALATFSRNS